MKGILENIGPEERAWMSTPFHPSVSYIVSFVASVDLSLIYSLYDADPPFVFNACFDVSLFVFLTTRLFSLVSRIGIT